MIVIACPNCNARYRLAESVLAKGGRLRCAECDHRWVPEAPPVANTPAPPEHDEEAAFAAVQQQMQARWDVPGPAAAPGPEPAPEPVNTNAEDEEPEAQPAAPKLLQTIVAVVAAVALSIAAAGLWLGNSDLAALPMAGPMLAQLDPPTPLILKISGVTTKLPAGGAVLEIRGSIGNPGKAAVRLPPLAASLSGPSGTLRWSIPPPIGVLPAQAEIVFTGTATGFPPDATTLSVKLVR